MGQLHSDQKKLEHSYNNHRKCKCENSINTDKQHCINQSNNENLNRSCCCRSQIVYENMTEQTGNLDKGTLNSGQNVSTKNTDTNITDPSTSNDPQCPVLTNEDQNFAHSTSFQNTSFADVGTSNQNTNVSSGTGAVLKPHKSLHRFCNLTSNLRGANAKSLFTPKRSKNMKNTHDTIPSFSNCDLSKVSLAKKKRPNWVMRFNCAKLKCRKAPDHRVINTNITSGDKRSSQNSNCVCTCYRQTEENNLASGTDQQPEKTVSNDQANMQMNSRVNSIISVTVQSLDNERSHRLYKSIENSSVDNGIEYSAMRKSSMPIITTNTSENNLIALCKCSSSVNCSPTNIGEPQLNLVTQKSLQNQNSEATVNNLVVYHNENSEVYDATESRLNPVFDVVSRRDTNVQNHQHQDISGSESLYGSLSDINNSSVVLDSSFDLVRLVDCNSSIIPINNHSSNCVQLLYPKEAESSHRCVQFICQSENLNRNNLTNTANSVYSPQMSDDCVRVTRCSFETQPANEIYSGQYNLSGTEHNMENSSQIVHEQSAHTCLNNSLPEQHICNNKIIIPGQRRCLQLVCPTDMSMESLRILFQSHFSLDTVAKCHTQIDYVHYLVPDLLQITSCSFYWGKMDRYEAERLLDGKPEGTFLLRDSAQEEFLFSVSFRKYGRSLHARIEQWNHKFSFDSHDPGVYSSDTVCGLIEHYKDPTCCMFFEPILTLPLHRNFTFTLQHLCRATITSKLKYDMIDCLQLPNVLKAYLKEYHYRQRVRVKRFDVGELQWVD